MHVLVKYMIIIADSHVSRAACNDKIFFKMLEKIEKTEEDLIFLGDIFELWIALPRYEKEIHRKFLYWCKEQKNHRTVGYIEGNHEFFLKKERSECFSWCSSAPCYLIDNKENLFCHGDCINRLDKKYLAFRKISKSELSYKLIRIFPFGRQLSEYIKKKLKKSNKSFKKYLPTEEIKLFAEARFQEGVKKIFAGHFHCKYTYSSLNDDNKKLYVIPDWFASKKVALYNEKSGELSYLNWSCI